MLILALVLIISMATLLKRMRSFGEGAEGVSARVTIKNCFHKMGTRKMVYTHASDTGACYPTEDHAASIRYEGCDLKICLAFASHKDATAFINRLFRDHSTVMGTASAKDVIDPKLEKISNYQVDYDKTVFHHHYDPDETESPEATAASVDSSVQVTFSMTDVSKFQSIQPSARLAGPGFQTCHIKSRVCCSKTESRDENNRLGLTPSLHVQFDGPPHGVPNMRLSVDDNAPPCVEQCWSTEHNMTQSRHRVTLIVEFSSLRAFRGMEGQFKEGTERVGEGPTHRSFVWVLDPTKFKEYIQWKYDDTTTKGFLPWSNAEEDAESDEGEGDGEGGAFDG